MSISNTERMELEGSPQQPEAKVATVLPKCRKKVTPVPRKKELLKDYLLTEPRFQNQPTRPITAGLQDATNFTLTLMGDPIIKEVVPHRKENSFKMTALLPEGINLDALLRMWNNTMFNDIIFTVQEFEIVIE